MPLTPPDPHNIAVILRDQLEQIRLLIEIYPRESAYPTAAEYVEAAILKLDPPQETPSP